MVSQWDMCGCVYRRKGSWIRTEASPIWATKLQSKVSSYDKKSCKFAELPIHIEI
jgi:hypothetical protein